MPGSRISKWRRRRQNGFFAWNTNKVQRVINSINKEIS